MRREGCDGPWSGCEEDGIEEGSVKSSDPLERGMWPGILRCLFVDRAENVSKVVLCRRSTSPDARRTREVASLVVDAYAQRLPTAR
jgi:hypothetical protein